MGRGARYTLKYVDLEDLYRSRWLADSLEGRQSQFFTKGTVKVMHRRFVTSIDDMFQQATLC